MFDYLSMLGNYDSRNVGNFTQGTLTVDTAEVFDGFKPYETGISDPRYHNGWIIVEAYETKELAQKGHECWVKRMTEMPPDQLTDCINCGLAELSSMNGKIFKRKDSNE